MSRSYTYMCYNILMYSPSRLVWSRECQEPVLSDVVFLCCCCTLAKAVWCENGTYSLRPSLDEEQRETDYMTQSLNICYLESVGQCMDRLLPVQRCCLKWSVATCQPPARLRGGETHTQCPMRGTHDRGAIGLPLARPPPPAPKKRKGGALGLLLAGN